MRWSREWETQIKKGSEQRLNHFPATPAFKALLQSNCSGSLLGPLQQLASDPWLHHLRRATYCRRTYLEVRHLSMENQNERNAVRRTELMGKYGHIIAKSAKWLELERERELERIAKARRDAAAAEQYLLDSDENERARKRRLATRQQLRLNKAARRASRRAMNAMKKTVEIADGTCDLPLLMDATSTSKWAGSSSPTRLEGATCPQLVQETEDDVRKFLQSIN